jgi:hypothetical protein
VDHLAALASADADRDGRLDLLVSVVQAGLDSWRAILQTADGGFAAGPAHAGGFTYGDLVLEGGLAVGDLNGDGNVDVASTNTDIVVPPGPPGQSGFAPIVSVYAGAGDGTFTVEPRGPYVVVHLRRGVAAGIADLDGDGRAELLVADAAAHELTIHRDALGANGIMTVPLPGLSGLAGALDVNGDGVPDLVLGAGSAPGTIAVALARPLPAGSAPDFGRLEVGSAGGVADVTVENRGTAPLAVAGVAISGAAAGDFSIARDACSGTSLASAARCSVGVRFRPTAVGRHDAAIVVSDGGGEPLRLAVTGVGLASLAVRAGCATRPRRARTRLTCGVVLAPGLTPYRVALRLVLGRRVRASVDLRAGGRAVLRAQRPLTHGRYTLVAVVVTADGRSLEARRAVAIV